MKKGKPFVDPLEGKLAKAPSKSILSGDFKDEDEPETNKQMLDRIIIYS